MKYYDENAGQYYENTINADSEELCFMFAEGAGRFLNAQSSRIRVLDLGCGSARDSFYLSEAGFAVTGIDSSFKLLAHSVSAGVDRLRNCSAGSRPSDAKSLTPVFICADFLKLPFKNSCFDAAFAQASLLHVPKNKIAAVIGEIDRVTRPGALIYFSVKEGSGERFDEKGRFFAYYDREELAAKFSGNGFKVVEFKRKCSRDGFNNEAVWLMYLAIKA